MEKSSSQGRFFVLSEGPVASPGHCVLCGYGGRERRYLDPRLDFEFFGSAIFCELCITAMGQEFGLISPDMVQEYQNHLEKTQTELIKYQAIALAAEELYVALGAVVGEDRPSSGDGDVNLSPNSNTTPDGGDPLANVEGESDRESAFDVSSLSEGPDDLLSLGRPDDDVFRL